MDLLPISDEYLRDQHTIRPGDRLHRLIARMADTHIDDLSDDRIEQIERLVDSFRLGHADGSRFNLRRRVVT